MAEVTTVQKRLEAIAERKLQSKIDGLRSYIKTSGLEIVFDNIKVTVEGTNHERTSLWFALTQVKTVATEMLLPNLIDQEVRAFMAKVDNLSEQIEELRGSIEGEN